MNDLVTIREAKIEDYKLIAEICCNDLGYSCEDELIKSKLLMLDHNRECVYVAMYEYKIHVEKQDTLYSETLANILGLAVAGNRRRLGAGLLTL